MQDFQPYFFSASFNVVLIPEFAETPPPIAIWLIPVFITYGTKDWNAPYNDLLQIESIQSELKNLTFKPYLDVEHNFFPVNENIEPNYEIYNWENVGKDWKNWLDKN